MADVFGSLPFDERHVKGVLRWINWIIIKTLFVCRELRVTEKSLVFSTNADDLLNLLLNGVFFRLVLLVSVLLLLLAFFFVLAVFVPLLSLLLGQKLLILFLVHLIWVVLSVHHLILLLSI